MIRCSIVLPLQALKLQLLLEKQMNDDLEHDQLVS
jgi:hypothetical protein